MNNLRVSKLLLDIRFQSSYLKMFDAFPLGCVYNILVIVVAKVSVLNSFLPIEHNIICALLGEKNSN